jgi:uncharacterized protein YdaU (DUF1376 family)
MAKDPAFLFYASDFLTGTMFMTNEQVGLYIRMLCAQHQHGGRIDTNVLRTQCDGITNGIQVFNKFEHDESGSFNPRLENEILLRKEKSLKAAESVRKRWDKSKENNTYERNTNVIRSEDENEDINENRDVDKNEKKPRGKFLQPQLKEVEDYMKERNSVAGGIWKIETVASESKKFWNFYESKGWMVGKNKMKDWNAAARNWMNTANEKNKSNGSREQTKSDLNDYINSKKELLFGGNIGGQI